MAATERPWRSEEKHMSEDQTAINKATCNRGTQAVNSGDADLISTTFDEVFDPDVLIRTPLPIGTTGVEAIKEVFTKLLGAFPDLHITTEDVIAEGDKVVSRNTVSGTHQGEYMGIPPTGKAVTWQEIMIVRFEDGRITETWGVVDVLSQMRQLGVIPAGPS
ncbi:ester cyclase [Actinomadura sp. 6K520]|uniref:ester cyclase n=1 Tax=Actinomadura sp. 6K520 TaxID=2530364 RepID=UPI001A9F0A31|nr:ester cyclase [Actinomadura sp. 6K520]